MDSLVLRPARFRKDRFVVDSDLPTEVVSWAELCSRFTPSQSPQGLRVLQLLRRGWFVGTVTQGGQPKVFVFDAAGKSSQIKTIVQRDPGFASRLESVFFVESVSWSTRTLEAVG
jgi:hypothetical protein